MTALQRRFHIKSERTVELEHEVKDAYGILHAELSREQQKLLLRLSDAENRLRDEEISKRSFRSSKPVSRS